MTSVWPSAGMWMLLLLGVANVTLRLPVWTLLIGLSSVFALGGMFAGILDAAVLRAVPARILGLLEYDLLQALPLYVFIGLLLQRLRVVDHVYDALAYLLRFSAGSQSLAALGVGALIAPMNGSVASSSALMARLVAPRLLRTMPGAPATALISVAATIGVVVPPSLVLLLLGDAMMQAHTQAQQIASMAQVTTRIINTQDVFHAALLPALAIFFLWSLVAWWQARTLQTRQPKPALDRRTLALATLTVTAVLVLLGVVFLGLMFAVEAAATAAVGLCLVALASRSLTAAQWRELLDDTLALSGALFALLVGATTFSLVFRLFGSDRWLSELVLDPRWSSQGSAALILLGVALCAWVLDAFEMIFVVIPIIAPALIARLGDAQQAAVLLLLVLQLSFLLPPMGYAVLMARQRAGSAVGSLRELGRCLLPFIAVQCLVTGAVFALPPLVHGLDAATQTDTQAPPSMQEIEKQMLDMGQ